MSTYLSNVRILIVDDQNFTRLLLRRILGTLGARRVDEAKDVETAWAQVLNSPPDLLIVDWELENLNGLELMRRVRHDPACPDKYMPTIMLTAYSEKPRIEIARDAGVNEFVIKPISPKTLFERISMVVEHPRRFVRCKDFFGPDRRRHKSSYRGKDRRQATTDPVDAPDDGKAPTS
ncbi:MAG: response regulator [Proteobacteria bacterium]|nr:response regulator [Pseudomonadota bacterium]